MATATIHNVQRLRLMLSFPFSWTSATSFLSPPPLASSSFIFVAQKSSFFSVYLIVMPFSGFLYLIEKLQNMIFGNETGLRIWQLTTSSLIMDVKTRFSISLSDL